MTNHNEVQNVPSEADLREIATVSARRRGPHDTTWTFDDLGLSIFVSRILAKHATAPLTVSLSPDPRGVHVAVHQGSECVHAEAMALPAALEIPEVIRTMATRIAADKFEHCTSDPIFTVQKRDLLSGLDPDYCEDIGWFHDGDQVMGEEAVALEAEYQDSGTEPDDYTRTGIRETWEHFATYVTQEAAQEFVTKKGDQYRVYVDSGCRNYEWKALRAFLLQIAASPTPPAGEGQEPVAWRHSKTGCLYETEEEVSLADGDEWAEPLYLHPAPQAAQGEQPAASVEPNCPDWKAINAAIDEYADGYELRGEPGDHTPTKSERFLIVDAINGLLAEPEFLALLTALVAAQPAQDEREAFEAWASAQGYLLRLTNQGGEYQNLRTEGAWKTWKARAALSTPPMDLGKKAISHLQRFRKSFVIAVGDTSPFARHALQDCDAAIAAMGKGGEQ